MCDASFRRAVKVPNMMSFLWNGAGYGRCSFESTRHTFFDLAPRLFRERRHHLLRHKLHEPFHVRRLGVTITAWLTSRSRRRHLLDVSPAEGIVGAQIAVLALVEALIV